LFAAHPISHNLLFVERFSERRTDLLVAGVGGDVTAKKPIWSIAKFKAITIVRPAQALPAKKQKVQTLTHTRAYTHTRIHTPFQIKA
jgi:hypothetical protein